MKLQWMKRRTVAVLTAGTVTLAAFSHSGAGLIDGLFEKDRCELPKRMPCGDCSFGFSQTNWRPWGTCCETAPPVSPGYSPEPLYVPGGNYRPLPETPYGTRIEVLPDGSRVIIESSPYGDGAPYGTGAAPLTDSPYPVQSAPFDPADPSGLPPILTEPAGGAGFDSSSQELLPGSRAPLSPNVRSIEAPAPLPPESGRRGPVLNEAPPPRSSQPGTNTFRDPMGEPIRGLVPGAGLPSGAQSAPAAIPPARGAAPVTDYSEYIPLPNADEAPQRVTIPNPAERAAQQRGARPAGDEPQGVEVIVPDSAAPADDSFDPGTLPLPEAGTRPDSQSAYDPYPGFRAMPAAGSVRPRFVQSRVGFEELPSVVESIEDGGVRRASARGTAGRDVAPHIQQLSSQPAYADEPAPAATRRSSVAYPPAGEVPVREAPVREVIEVQPEYTVPDWRPLSDPTKTYRSVTPPPGRDWQTMQTPTGRTAPRVNSEQQSQPNRVTSPPWKRDTSSSSRSRFGASTATPRSARATIVPPRQSASAVDSRGLPSVEALLGSDELADSRPARVVQETLYDVVDVGPSARRSAGGYSALSSHPQSASANGASGWQPINAANGREQTSALSSGFRTY